jgi:hypothetical protein
MLTNIVKESMDGLNNKNVQGVLVEYDAQLFARKKISKHLRSNLFEAIGDEVHVNEEDETKIDFLDLSIQCSTSLVLTNTLIEYEDSLVEMNYSSYVNSFRSDNISLTLNKFRRDILSQLDSDCVFLDLSILTEVAQDEKAHDNLFILKEISNEVMDIIKELKNRKSLIYIFCDKEKSKVIKEVFSDFLNLFYVTQLKSDEQAIWDYFNSSYRIKCYHENQFKFDLKSFSSSTIKLIKSYCSYQGKKAIAMKLNELIHFLISFDREDEEELEDKLIQYVDDNFKVGKTKFNKDQIKELKNKLEHCREFSSELVKDLRILEHSVKSTDNAPVGVYLIRGPSGCGKTFSATILKETLDIPLIRLDFNNFTTKEDSWALIGSPRGYEGDTRGGSLHIKIKEAGLGLKILLIDEIEKAPPEIINILLKLLDTGIGYDNRVGDYSASNLIVIMTSNVGEKESSRTKLVGLNSIDSLQVKRDRIRNDELKNTFSPEFMSRVSRDFIFKPLGTPQISSIFSKCLGGEISTCLEIVRGEIEISRDFISDYLDTNDLSGDIRKAKTSLSNHIKNAIIDIYESEEDLINNISFASEGIVSYKTISKDVEITKCLRSDYRGMNINNVIYAKRIESVTHN